MYRVYLCIYGGKGVYGKGGISDQCVKKGWIIEEMYWDNRVFGKILRHLPTIMQNLILGRIKIYS